MKTTKINPFKNVMSFLLVVVLFTSACAQTGKNDNTTNQKEIDTKTVAMQPEIDIHAAVISGNLEIVKQHIAAGTNINEKDVMSGSTPLISAATFNKLEIAKALIDAKADMSLQNNDGSTALHSAAFFGRIEIVQVLMDANADRTIRNNFGATPRETVMGEFSEIKPVYEMLKQQLSPLGFELDMEALKKSRPAIALMLQ